MSMLEPRAPKFFSFISPLSKQIKVSALAFFFPQYWLGTSLRQVLTCCIAIIQDRALS